MKISAILVLALTIGTAGAQSSSFIPTWRPGDPPPYNPGPKAQPPTLPSMGSPSMASAPSPLPATWNATVQDGTYRDTGTAGSHELILEVPQGSRHFQVEIVDIGVPKITSPITQISISYLGGQTFQFAAKSDYSDQLHANVFMADLPDDEVKIWTHDLTALKSAFVSYPDSSIPGWTIALAGTTASVTAMASAMNDAGIVNLPSPWTPEGDSEPSNVGDIASPQSLTANLPSPGPPGIPATPKVAAVPSDPMSVDDFNSASQSILGQITSVVGFFACSSSGRCGMYATNSADIVQIDASNLPPHEKRKARRCNTTDAICRAVVTGTVTNSDGTTSLLINTISWINVN